MSLWNTRFTKRTFVRVKNTQKLETAYLIQLFSLNMNMNSILKLRQRFENVLQISFFFKNSLMIFLFFFQIVANFIIIITKLKKIVAHYEYDAFVFIRRSGAKLTKNEKWLAFKGRWMNLKTDSRFKLRERNGIMWVSSSFWGFLCRTKCLFLNRGNLVPILNPKQHIMSWKVGWL